MSHRLLALTFLALSLTLAACDKPEDKAAKYIDRGNAQFEKKDYVRARLEYKNAARILPTQAEAPYRLALIDEAEGKIGPAIKGFMAAEQQVPTHAGALKKLAHYFLAAGEFNEAAKRIDALLAQLPDDPQAHALKAAFFLRQKNLVEAEKEAHFALEKDKGHVLATSVMAGLASSRGDNQAAFTYLDEGLKVNPKELSLLMLRVMLYAKSDDLPQMAKAYQTIFESHPEAFQFRFDLADSWAKAGKLDEAEAVLREALKALPDNRDVRRKLFVFLSEHRGFAAAEKELNGYIAETPDNDELPFWLAELYMKNNAGDKAVALLENIARKTEEQTSGLNARTVLARIYLTQGQRDVAERLVSFVLSQNPNSADALFVRARLSYDKGDFEKAVVDLRTIAQNKESAPRALLLLAETLLKQGRIDLATDALIQLLSQEPTDQKARVRLAQFFGLQGDVNRAIETIMLVNKMDPQYAIGWESAARLYIEAKKWEQAGKAIDKLEALDGQKLTALFLRAEIWGQTNQKPLAINAYKQVIQTDPDAPLAEHALRSLAGLEPSVKHLQEVASFAGQMNFTTASATTLYGQILGTAGKLQEAAEAFDKALTLSPQTQDAFVERAKLYLGTKQTAQAVNLLQKAIQQIPTDVRAAFLLADIRTIEKQYDEAIKIYQGLLSQNPSLDLAANNLAQLIADYKSGDARLMDEARRVAERFIASSNPYFLDTLGWVYFRSGDIAQATPVLERSSQMVKTMPAQMHYHYAALMAKLGRMAEARESLAKATADGVSYPGLDEAKKLVDGIR